MSSVTIIKKHCGFGNIIILEIGLSEQRCITHKMLNLARMLNDIKFKVISDQKLNYTNVYQNNTAETGNIHVTE